MQNVKVNSEIPVDPIIHIVDDDEEFRNSLLDLFVVTKKRASAYSSASEFLLLADTSAPGCVLVDVKMPGVSGLELQKRLLSIGSRLPVIFLTACADIATIVGAMKAGAADFIIKPFANPDLLQAVDHAIRLGSERWKTDAELDRVRSLADTLTPREREVTFAVVSGLMNKQVAYQLGISEMTVKLHRMNAMRKMQSRSLADLVRKVEQIQRTE